MNFESKAGRMDDPRVNPSSSMEHLTIQQGDRDEGGTVEGAGVIQDQIIIAPEIMRLILKQLNLQTLKRVRLVCKSWLREATTHMEKRGTVRFYSETLNKFVETFQNGVPELPKPFSSIRVSSSNTEDWGLFVRQLASVCPPLLITRFDARGTPLDLAVALIIKSSASLEYLHLVTETIRQGVIPARSILFLKLRAIYMDPWEDFPPSCSEYFPSVVARIVECSPNLEEYRSGGDGEQTNGALLKADLKNIKILELCHGNLSFAVVDHIIHTQFSRLEELTMCLDEDFVMGRYGLFPLYATVAKCTATLRILELSFVDDPDVLTNFPVCPHLQELFLNSFPGPSRDWLSVCFPALEVLTVNRIAVDVLGSWNDLTPFRSLKTLRAYKISLGSKSENDSSSGEDKKNSNDGDRMEEPVKFFAKFPALECLGTDPAFAVHCCRLKATGRDSRFTSLLEGVKSLELAGNDVGSANVDLASLAVLKGVERIAITSGCSSDLLTLPYKDMPALKVIQLPWNWDREVICPMDQLLEMARGVEKVVVTRDCRGRGSLDVPLDLQLFFYSALNAEAGLNEWQKTDVM